MTGKVTLEFYTRTLNDALYPGTLCIYLFDRHETGSAKPGRHRLAADQQTASATTGPTPRRENGFWPRNAWTKVRLTMEFNGRPTHDPDRATGSASALSVDPGNTPADAIPIMYDHPNYPTRLEVDTDTPIEAGGASRWPPPRRSPSSEG